MKPSSLCAPGDELVGRFKLDLFVDGVAITGTGSFFANIFQPDEDVGPLPALGLNCAFLSMGETDSSREISGSPVVASLYHSIAGDVLSFAFVEMSPSASSLY